MMQTFISKEFIQSTNHLLDYTWSDIDNFWKKYDSKVDAEGSALRNSVFFKYDALGYMLREGLMEPDLVYRTGGFLSVWIWVKFHEVIRSWRKMSGSGDYCSDFEYLAGEMWSMLREKNPSFVTDPTNFPEDTLEKAFSTTSQ